MKIIFCANCLLRESLCPHYKNAGRTEGLLVGSSTKICCTSCRTTRAPMSTGGRWCPVGSIGSADQGRSALQFGGWRSSRKRRPCTLVSIRRLACWSQFMPFFGVVDLKDISGHLHGCVSRSSDVSVPTRIADKIKVNLEASSSTSEFLLQKLKYLNFFGVSAPTANVVVLFFTQVLATLATVCFSITFANVAIAGRGSVSNLYRSRDIRNPVKVIIFFFIIHYVTRWLILWTCFGQLLV